MEKVKDSSLEGCESPLKRSRTAVDSSSEDSAKTFRLPSEEQKSADDGSSKAFDPSSGEEKSSDGSNRSTVRSEEKSPLEDESMADDDDDTSSFDTEEYVGNLSDYESEEVYNQFKEYSRQMYKSEGFDIEVEAIPKVLFLDGIYPLDLDDDGDDIGYGPHIMYHAKNAVKQYNAENNAKVEFAGIQKANLRRCLGGVNFYITFEGKDTVSGELKDYQAKAYHAYAECDRKVLFVRLAPGQ